MSMALNDIRILDSDQALALSRELPDRAPPFAAAPDASRATAINARAPSACLGRRGLFAQARTGPVPPGQTSSRHLRTSP